MDSTADTRLGALVVGRVLAILCLSAVSGLFVPGCRTVADDPRLAPLDAVVREEIEAGHIPGAVVLAGRGNRILYHKAFGDRVVEPTREPMDRDTIFDLASLTKPIATATCVLILADRNQLDPNDYVRDYLPTFAAGGKDRVRLKHLLTHTSGLPAYTNAATLEAEHGGVCPDRVIDRICTLDSLSAPGEQFRYSCLGYIVLAKIVEIVAGESIADFSRANVFRPLRMNRTAFSPGAAWQPRIAASEIGNGRPLRGMVHDPLARLMGGVSGNAGLFSTASDLATYCRMLLNGGVFEGERILSSRSVTLLTTVQSHGRAYGFDVSSSYSWAKGRHAPSGTFCHTGYTGASLVCDPSTGRFVIILTNRVHPRDDGTTRPIRTRIAEIVLPGERRANM